MEVMLRYFYINLCATQKIFLLTLNKINENQNFYFIDFPGKSTYFYGHVFKITMPILMK